MHVELSAFQIGPHIGWRRVEGQVRGFQFRREHAPPALVEVALGRHRVHRRRTPAHADLPASAPSRLALGHRFDRSELRAIPLKPGLDRVRRDGGRRHRVQARPPAGARRMTRRRHSTATPAHQTTPRGPPVRLGPAPPPLIERVHARRCGGVPGAVRMVHGTVPVSRRRRKPGGGLLGRETLDGRRRRGTGRQGY
jgi:hypothetical protein